MRPKIREVVLIMFTVLVLSPVIISMDRKLQKSTEDRYGTIYIYSGTGEEFSYYGKIHIDDNGDIELYTE